MTQDLAGPAGSRERTTRRAGQPTPLWSTPQDAIMTAGNPSRSGTYYVAECSTDNWSCRHRHEFPVPAAWCGWVKYGPDRYAADAKVGPDATPSWRVRRYTPGGTRIPLSQADYDEMLAAFIAWDESTPDEN